ncbi:mucin-13 [Pantherophis guttatus]|uniref:Mucin-13 n=1 Tax=Pantherophis guttatus TaxID=94885 RepID=A0A6P9DAY0_PANGU|nr:mucin-13 [Pantherophis guttatus]
MTDYLTFNTVECHAESYTYLQLHSKIIYQCPYGFFYYNSTCRLGISGCQIVICDNTTNCMDVEGGIPKCECKKGLDKVNPEDKACRVCDQGCSAGSNTFCRIKADLPECQCLPNFEEKDGECKACSIGFSGENCQDSYMAIIIGVSTLCGVLLVALIGVTTYSLVRKPDPKTEHRQLISNEYATLGNRSGAPPATNFAESGKIFPRIRGTNDAPLSKATAENPTNFYEGGAANRGYFPEQDYSNDNWLEMPSRY